MLFFAYSFRFSDVQNMLYYIFRKVLNSFQIIILFFCHHDNFVILLLQRFIEKKTFYNKCPIMQQKSKMIFSMKPTLSSENVMHICALFARK